MKPSRREVLVGTAALHLLPWRSAVAAPIEPVPLSFDPARLPGLSEKLLRSHWENNYGGAVKNLAKTREQLGSVTKDTPAMLVAGLMERELLFRNSVVLHELYFATLGGAGGPQGSVASKLSTAFGTFARFEERLRLACAGLYGGSGWVILAHDPRDRALHLYASANHTQAAAVGVPILVCDMYEHSYHMDYGTAAARYVDAFMANLDWEIVDGRYRAAIA